MPIPRQRRAFAAWLEANQHRLAVPMRIMPHGRGRGRTSISFDGFDPRILHARFNDWTLRVSAYKPGCRWEWDGLLDVDVSVQPALGGYVCGTCREEKPQEQVPVFPTREALWADHLFEPLLEFVNAEMAPARSLVFWGGDGGATWAKLIRDKPPAEEGEPTCIVPLRPENR